MEIKDCQYCTKEIIVKKAVSDNKYAECNACGKPSHLDCLLKHRVCISCQSGEARFSPKEITDIILADPMEQFAACYEVKRGDSKYQDLGPKSLAQIVCHELQLPREERYNTLAQKLNKLSYPVGPVRGIARGAAIGGVLGTVSGIGIAVFDLLFGGGLGNVGFHLVLYATTGYAAYLGANNRYNAWKKKVKKYMHKRQSILNDLKKTGPKPFVQGAVAVQSPLDET